ncbi:MarR family transcriptional regulator [Candidatus Woesearchaeota archaeon]|nr:MAG: MarR family transcriptional regulator [Candidatus Woesearchaeota archaeon]
MKRMGSFGQYGVLLCFVFLLTPAGVSAASSVSVSIQDVVTGTVTIDETVNITLTNYTEELLTFALPAGAVDVLVNGQEAEVSENAVHIPLSCTTCTVRINYHLPEGIITRSEEFLLYHTMLFPFAPDVLNYRIVLPRQFVLSQMSGVELPIVPFPDDVQFQSSETVIQWHESRPVLPKIYSVAFERAEKMETRRREVMDELAERSVLVIILVVTVLSLFIGGAIGASMVSYLRKPKEEILYVPSSLLSPDEKVIVRLLKEQGNKLSQKDIAKLLQWSKSKVSAVVTTLEYKEVIRREKVGRSYTVELVMGVEDL